MSRRESVTAQRSPLDVSQIREDFPILARRVHEQRLVYLDSAATTQKPRRVMDALVEFWTEANASVHRGTHVLARDATARYEGVRRRVAAFLGADDERGIVFTRNATESLNLVATSWGAANVSPGDEIVVTELEHHSNLLPWMRLARQKGARLRRVPIRQDGLLDMERFGRALSERTRVVAVAMVSNVLGTITPIAQVTAEAHDVGARVVVDAAQAAPHMPVRVQEIDCDFLALSAHKMLGPDGVGVLYGKPELLEAMEPFLVGGEMVDRVRPDDASWNDVPWKFEAGTPNVSGVIAFGEAVAYLEELGLDRVREHEIQLVRYTLLRLEEIGGVRVFGPPEPERRSGVISFVDSLVAPHELSAMLDLEGVAIRSGHLCAQPLLDRLGVDSLARASFYVYNDVADADQLVDSIARTRSLLA